MCNIFNVFIAGIYDEQFEMSSKIPFELVGSGSLGSTVLIMCVEQSALTGRLCNLVLKAPWFTSHVLKVSMIIPNHQVNTQKRHQLCYHLVGIVDVFIIL